MKRALGLDFVRQGLLCLACVSLGHWILSLAYAKCGSPPAWPADYSNLDEASEFQWEAWESAMGSYNFCMRGYWGWKTVMLFITFCFYAYAGFRRIQMRRRFGLPGDDVRDYASWLLCPCCSLAQETRTLAANRVDAGVWHGPPVMLAQAHATAFMPPAQHAMNAQQGAWGAAQQHAWQPQQPQTVGGYVPPAAPAAPPPAPAAAAKEEDDLLLLGDDALSASTYTPPPVPPPPPPAQP